jgi:hypothetical protein
MFPLFDPAGGSLTDVVFGASGTLSATIPTLGFVGATGSYTGNVYFLLVTADYDMTLGSMPLSGNFPITVGGLEELTVPFTIASTTTTDLNLFDGTGNASLFVGINLNSDAGPIATEYASGNATLTYDFGAAADPPSSPEPSGLVLGLIACVIGAVYCARSKR